jgi:hypothetical protein
MTASLVTTSVLVRHGRWPLDLAETLLLAAGIGHAPGFSRLAHRLTTLVPPAQATDLSD